MSYNSWSLGRGGVPYSGIGSGGMGGWGGGTGGERQRDEAIFTSLVPVNGRVSGSQVKNVFQASGLTQQQLAKIWTMADRDGDGYINMSEFCSAMAAIRQAKQQLQQTTSLQWPSKGGGAGGTFGGGMQSQPLDPSQQISKSLTFPSLKEPTSPMVTQSLQSVGIVGKGVTSEGWKISPAEKRRYVTQFGTYDRMKTGYLPGVDIKPVLNQSGLDQTILAKIWTLADIDKDGRLSVEEFSIAMHLIDKAKIGVTLPLTLPPDLLPSSNDSGTPPSTVATTPTSKTPWTFEDKKRENFDAGRQELERRRRAIQEKQEKEEAEKERKRRQEEEQRRQQEMEAEKRRQAELERQNRRALEIQRERERQLAKLTEQREAELREEERRRKEEWARRRQVELEGVKEWEMKALRALQSQHSNLENELQQLDQQKMASRDSVLRQSSLCDELRKALRSMRLSDEVKRAEITKLRTELHALQSKLTSLATQRAQFQASLQARNPQSLQYQKERQVYQDGIMGVAAVLAGLRSTLKSGAESYQKQEQLMKNNIMTFSELQTELQKNTAKTSTLKSQVAHHRSQWEERERRGREEAKRRQEAEKRERQEKERLAREAREMRIKKQQSQALKEAKEAKAREEKAKATEELTRLMKKGTTSPSPPPQVTPTRHSIPPAPNPRPKRLPPKPTPYQPSTTTTTTTTANEALKKLAAILNQEITSSPLVAIATTTNSNIGVAGKKEVKAKDEKAKVKEVKKKVIELKQRKAEIEKQKRSLPSKPMPYPGSKLRKQTSLSTSPPPLLDIEASCDTSAQSTGFIPNPQSSFNPLEPLRTSSETSLSNVFGVSGGESSPVKFPTTENREIVHPVFQLGQPGLSLKGQPAVADKGRATVTGSQVEALSVVDGDPLYATVNKTRSNTRSNLDYVSAGRRSSEKPPSVSPPPKDWVVIGNEEISRSNSEQIMTAQTISSSEPSATSSTQPITSTPKRTTTSPSLVTSNSTNQPLSSSWVDLQSTTNHARDETTNEPLYMSPRQHHGDEATTSSHRIITYRALYSFTAKQESEVSFQEGDVFNSIPGELPSNGWLLVEIKGQQGLVPESYLEEVDLGRGSLERELEDAACQGDQQATEKAKVMFTWKGSKDNHLSIKKGQVIDILTKSEKWWSGRVEGKVGWFPKTFVKIVEVDEGEQQVTVAEEAGGQNQSVATATVSQPSRSETTPPSSTTAAAVTTSADLYQALYDYDSIEPGDLRFKTGDVIKVTDKDGEWWKGSLNEQFGSFPSNYVKHHVPETTPLRSSTVPAIPPSPSPSPSSSSLASDTSVTSHVKPLVARVTKQYMATKETELSLKAGQYVKVYKQSGSGWWHGELQSRGKQRQTGWFPADHVDLLQKPNTTSSTTNSTPPPSVSSSSSSSGQQAAGSNNSGSAAQSVLGAQRSKSPLIDILDPPDPHSLSQNLVLALYTYTAASSDELTFHKGSVITVLVKKGEWWKGELNGVAGLFPSNYVQPLNETPATTSEATRWAESVSPEVLASVSKTERKRQEAIFELLSSERNYTDSLKFVREVYFEPMVDSGVLTDEEMNKVRVNWDELIQCNGNMLNAFLVRLRTSGSVVKNIGDILHTQIPLLMPHVRWCSCQLTACTLLQSKSSDPLFKEFEQKCAEDQRAAGLPLSSFLLKPMQRITKYPLLIQRILDYTTEDNTDRDELQAALEEAQKLCHSVNEAVRSKENTEHLEWLQNNVQFSLDETLIFNSQTNFLGQRKLLHWGKLFKIRGNRDLVGFLFNDFYLLVKPKHFFSRAATPAELEPFGKNEFVMYRTPYLLGDIKVNKASAEQHGPSVFLMNYPSEEKDIPLKADSDPARDVWIKMIQDAKHEYLKTKRRSEQEIKKKWAQTMKHSVGVLKVTVVKAEDLKASDPNGKSDPFCVLSFSQQEENTPVVNSNLNPKWNYTVQFAVHDLNQDVLEITVFDQDIFSPNDFLGCGRVVLKDLLQEGDSPWRKQVLLEDVSSGEVELVLELSLNKSDLLL